MLSFLNVLIHGETIICSSFEHTSCGGITASSSSRLSRAMEKQLKGLQSQKNVLEEEMTARAYHGIHFRVFFSSL